jgi:C4-dicarboxylate transporter DctM subunit
MMTPELLCALGFAAVIVLLMLRTPIGVALGLTGLVGLSLLISPEAALIKSAVVSWETISKYELGVLPLFLFMAHLLFSAGASTRLFDLAAKFMGHRRGGLALASIAGCAGFGSIAGSSLATAATMGLVALPEMRKAGYAPGLASASLAAGGTLGVLIPPSGALIVFGVIAEQSIGDLFIAGVIPGVTQALVYMAVIWFLCFRNPLLAPRQPRAPWSERLPALAGAGDMIGLIVLVIGGLLVGWFSPTEAAAVGAIGAMAISAFRGKLNLVSLRAALVETMRTAGLIYFVIIGALIFSSFVGASGFSDMVAGWMEASPLGVWGTIIIMAVILIGLGMFLDGMGIMLLTTPIFLPIIEAYGLSAIWFGIFLVRTIEIGFLTPPVGMNVYVIHGIARDIPVATIYRGVVPFFISDLLHLAALVAFPMLALWLPSVLGG